jgi:hypothetical protein
MALTNIACNNCASPSSSSADQISSKWKGKKWKILIIRDIDFRKMRVQSDHRIYSRPYATLKLNHFTWSKWITYTFSLSTKLPYYYRLQMYHPLAHVGTYYHRMDMMLLRFHPHYILLSDLELVYEYHLEYFLLSHKL